MHSLFIIFIILLFSLILSSFLGNIVESFVVVSDVSGNYNDNTSTSDTNTGYTGYTSYDNYNHYDKTYDDNINVVSGTIFYGENGGEAIVITDSNGQKVIKIVLPDDNTTYDYIYVSKNTWTGSNGTATLIQTSNGTYSLNIKLNNGETYIYTNASPQSTNVDNYYYNSNNLSNNQQTSPPPPPPPPASSQYTYQNYDPMTTGIPKRMIPKGEEDMYVSKSSVIVPVCPICPSPIISNESDKECPPCPACARCPEPSFECKKVPNYNAVNNEILPQSILTNYPQYGM